MSIAAQLRYIRSSYHTKIHPFDSRLIKIDKKKNVDFSQERIYTDEQEDTFFYCTSDKNQLFLQLEYYTIFCIL